MPGDIGVFQGGNERPTLVNAQPRIVREPHIAGTVAIINGLPGCGKTLMTAIVGTLERVELMRYNFHLEHVCVLWHLGALAEDAAIALLRLQTDLDLYDGTMGRETNFRFSDISSPWTNGRMLRYVARLFQAGDAAAVERIKTQRPILHLATHSLLGVGGVLLKALGARLRFVEVVRHPLYMIKQWYMWMPRVGTDPRMFGLWIEHRGAALPWWARGWEELFLESNRMDRTIYAIETQWRMAMETLDTMSPEERASVLVVPFERFVVSPEPYLDELQRFLGTSVTAETRRMMKRQNVPRQMYAEGIPLKIYKQYGWEPPEKGSDEARELARRREWVMAEASVAALKTLDELSESYEAHYLAI
jgi:hypothetical protein